MGSNDLLALSLPVGSAVFAGVGTYLLTHRDFRGRGTAPVSVGCAIVVGAMSWFAPSSSRCSPSSLPQPPIW
jgi:hypothetical protein